MPAVLIPRESWLPLRFAPSPGTVREAELELSSASPWLDGHFPGRPLLPGVGLLAFVWETARQGLGPDAALLGFRSVRFKRLVDPGARLRIVVLPAEGNGEDPSGRRQLRFTVSMAGDGEPVCQGALLASESSQR